jgi:hypothetical protein
LLTINKPLVISAVARERKIIFDGSLGHNIKRNREIGVHRELEDARGKSDNGAHTALDKPLAQVIKSHHEIGTQDDLEDARRQFSVWADNLFARFLDEDSERRHNFEQGKEISTYCELEDSRGKFNIWANNIGALQEPRSKKSLDSQLKDAPVMLSAFISEIKRLQRSLVRSISQLFIDFKADD